MAGPARVRVIGKNDRRERRIPAAALIAPGVKELKPRARAANGPGRVVAAILRATSPTVG